MSKQDDLENAAYAVADEERDRWTGDGPTDPRDDWWDALVAELERRCPGFTKEEYDKALNDGFVASR